MAKTPFGLITLMESMRHSEEQQMESQALFEAVTGSNSVGSIVKDQFLSDDIESDMGDDVDENDPELNKLLELIPEDDDDEEMLEKLDGILEAAIIQDMNGNGEY